MTWCRRLAWQPLLDSLPGDVETWDATATRFGTSTRNIHRWRQRKSLSLRMGELIADNLALHPTQIWDDYDEVVQALESA